MPKLYLPNFFRSKKPEQIDKTHRGFITGHNNMHHVVRSNIAVIGAQQSGKTAIVKALLNEFQLVDKHQYVPTFDMETSHIIHNYENRVVHTHKAPTEQNQLLVVREVPTAVEAEDKNYVLNNANVIVCVIDLSKSIEEQMGKIKMDYNVPDHIPKLIIGINKQQAGSALSSQMNQLHHYENTNSYIYDKSLDAGDVFNVRYAFLQAAWLALPNNLRDKLKLSTLITGFEIQDSIQQGINKSVATNPVFTHFKLGILNGSIQRVENALTKMPDSLDKNNLQNFHESLINLRGKLQRVVLTRLPDSLKAATDFNCSLPNDLQTKLNQMDVMADIEEAVNGVNTITSNVLYQLSVEKGAKLSNEGAITNIQNITATMQRAFGYGDGSTSKLLAVVAITAACTIVGAGIGFVLGGVGSIPMATLGAVVGIKISTTLLGCAALAGSVGLGVSTKTVFNHGVDNYWKVMHGINDLVENTIKIIEKHGASDDSSTIYKGTKFQL